MRSLISRRNFLATGAAALAASPARSEDDAPLRVRAEKRGLYFGCAVQKEQFQDIPYMQAVGREANILVPEGELKWPDVHPEPDRYDFTGADAIAKFAAQNKMQMRGHTLAWYASNPPWLEVELLEKRNERVLTDHIATVAGHYRGRMHSWDVVNEAIDPTQGHPDGLRLKSPWQKAFGSSYIDTAFHAAREADPNALLFLNEYDIESASWWFGRRRLALLRLCEKLRARRVPIDAIGIQGHLKAFREPFNENIFSEFLSDIRSLGLKFMITEFDVADIDGPADIAKRDAEVASLTRRFMNVALDSPASLGVLTWGLSDRYSWLSHPVWGRDYKWPDGQLSRGLPLDSDLQRKPMWHAIANAFRS